MRLLPGGAFRPLAAFAQQKRLLREPYEVSLRDKAIAFALRQIAVGGFGELQEPEGPFSPLEHIDAARRRVAGHGDKQQHRSGKLDPAERSRFGNLQEAANRFLGGYVCRRLETEIAEVE